MNRVNGNRHSHHHAFKGVGQQSRSLQPRPANGSSLTVNCSVFLSLWPSFVTEHDIQHLSLRAREDMTHSGNERDCLLMLSLEKWWEMLARHLEEISAKDRPSQEKEIHRCAGIRSWCIELCICILWSAEWGGKSCHMKLAGSSLGICALTLTEGKPWGHFDGKQSFSTVTQKKSSHNLLLRDSGNGTMSWGKGSPQETESRVASTYYL